MCEQAATHSRAANRRGRRRRVPSTMRPSGEHSTADSTSVSAPKAASRNDSVYEPRIVGDDDEVVGQVRRREMRRPDDVRRSRAQASELRGDVRPCPPLPASLGDGLAKRDEAAYDHIPRRSQPRRSHSSIHSAGVQVTALTVASPARRHLVLDPRRPTFDTGHDVFGRGSHSPAERATAPHTTGAVALEHQLQSLGACRLRRERPHGHRRQVTCAEHRQAMASGRFAPSPTGHCTSATCAPRSPRGRSLARPARASSCGWRTSTPWPSRAEHEAAHRPIWPRSASTGTAGRAPVRAFRPVRGGDRPLVAPA